LDVNLLAPEHREPDLDAPISLAELVASRRRRLRAMPADLIDVDYE